jgi:hypothetical protein
VINFYTDVSYHPMHSRAVSRVHLQYGTSQCLSIQSQAQPFSGVSQQKAASRVHSQTVYDFMFFRSAKTTQHVDVGERSKKNKRNASYLKLV